MIMKLITLFSVFCICSSELQVYVAPNCDNCTVALHSCYTLHQIIAENLLYSNEDSVEMIFMAGTHLIADNQVLRVLNFSQVVFNSNEKEEVVIECESEAGLGFQNVVNLSISSLHFKSCYLWYNNSDSISQHDRTVTITGCVFERSKTQRAISFNSTVQNRVNATISNCTFQFSDIGAITFQCIHCLNRGNMATLWILNTVFNAINSREQSNSALKILQSTLIVNASYFMNNKVRSGIIFANNSNVTIKYTRFHCNSVRGLGSAIYITMSSLQVDHCHFTENYAIYSYGIITIDWSQKALPSYFNNSVFQQNSAYDSVHGGALSILYADITILNCKFINNSAQDGGVVYCYGFGHVIIKSSIFALNTAQSGGGLAYLKNCQLNIENSNISSNRALNGGAMYADKSTINIGMNVELNNNYARENGGALYLSLSLILNLFHLIKFSYNVADDKGGAIFVSDTNCETVMYHSQCFIQDYSSNGHSFTFTNNSAYQGPVLYGGLLDRCFTSSDGLLGIIELKNVSRFEHTPLAITSAPVRVCLCAENYKPNCSKRVLELTKMSGEVFELIGTVVDQDSNPISSSILASYEYSSSAQLDIGEGRKEAGSNCSRLSYHVFTRNTSTVQLILQPEGYCQLSNFSSLKVHINIAPCSRGFELHSDRCGCDRRLTNHLNITTCNISTDSVQRKGAAWLVYDQQDLKVHTSCPLDYCQMLSDTISLAHPDEQCANHRSGVLCGACQHNYSIALGGSKCLQCTSSYAFAWLILVFAVAGVALVALLLVCNLTVAHGTLDGLIFYANVVSITGLTNLPSCSIHPILSIFIAWVNLDFGVETCFYAGMDTYQKTWLQLAFPLYIWVLVGVIILACHYSGRAMKVFGINNVAILATLFLLSYTKILKTITASINFTEVLVGSANDTSDRLIPYKVWTYDGSIAYLTGKHTPLFVAGLVLLVFVFLPYTLILTFGQCIRSMQTRVKCVRRCIHSTAFVSIMDAYHAPYNKRHRYWTGLMLLTRCVLFLAIASNYNNYQLLTSMYITNVILFGIVILKTCITYTNCYINLLELCFLLNLAVLSSTVYYLRSNNYSESNVCRSTSASISFSLVGFIGILMYHFFLRIKKTKPFTCINISIPITLSKRTIPSEESKPLNPEQKIPTTTSVEVREELLDVDEI